MNLHIFHDDKFTNGGIEQFENYFPKQNIYILLLYNDKTPKYTISHPDILIFHIRDKNLVLKIREVVGEKNVKNLFIHYLDTFKASITSKILSQNSTLKVYWIFYGGDLYDYLSKYHQYDIIDDKSIQKTTVKESIVKTIKYLLWFGWTPKAGMDRFFKRLDFFCFWNEFDYELFKSKTKSNANYKNFVYINALGDSNFPTTQKSNTIMINHSASITGNHSFVLDSIKSLPLKENNYNLLLPLSYGNENYANEIEIYAKNNIITDITSLRSFMPLNEYQNLLSTVKIAIFGMRRQEAAGNIFQLINMGTKVFLREENTLLQWLRKRDFIVFSLENEYDELSNLDGLFDDQIQHNKDCYKKVFNDKIFTEMMHNLMITD
ncbi:TDP-N-acetylfucosamine:lipid II N-acetylfucosaminyltransferase [Sphingobacterium bovistauri]|uniref:TDP-N-acetylfucosamine:lipid II N-acetylfucosaminyltransferase n=1 Tax=Sphingobacterium bovistauri TaxID=2781959 RepID=A0ABS7Z462_9SPHI|nr:TDP-N-acetylfucosamine:lipid II N-acetylfucosaminyltransferase [Sphingobacterium bovistauri]MCA5004211.1 TDP-N-acetylfucosamine:lipid II N-acetylfucosaminyltransferase [Sphingobacterium bovistauri]